MRLVGFEVGKLVGCTWVVLDVEVLQPEAPALLLHHGGLQVLLDRPPGHHVVREGGLGQVSGARCQVPGARCQVPGARQCGRST